MHAHPENLKLLVAAVFCRAGSESEEANCLAEHLVESNLAGHDSHGVIRVVEYMGWVNDKKICPNQKLAVLVDSETLLVADGQLGYGQVVAAQAVKLGIEKATRGGTAVVALRRCSHLGRMGHWAEMAAAAKQVSLHFATTNGLGTLAAPLGGTERRLSANPVAIGIPRTNADPLVLDIATCAIAEGKLKVARNSGQPVPTGCILDGQGNPTTDANRYYSDPPGAILPFGGHKGYGLSVAIQLLAGALTGNGCSHHGKNQLEQGMLSIFLDPQQFECPNEFATEVQQFVDFVKTSALATDTEEILVPGEIESRKRAHRGQQGIELDETTWGQLVAEARRWGIEESFIEAAQRPVRAA